MELTAEEGRVLGSLVEKQLTTPQQYPLTENALLAACNQTTSRDPVVQYDVATVRLAVRSLRERELVRTVHRSGERSEKHRHLLEESLGLTTPQQALLALLVLRGPQTAAELRARSDRMHSFDSPGGVEEALRALAERPEPLLERLPRLPGQKEARYADLLVETGGSTASASAPAPAPAPPPARLPVRAAPPAGGLDLAALAAEVGALRAEVAQLRTELRDQNRGGSV
ncbi:MAG: protein yceH [Frankiales bacterium]|nr:protein yceH [Frankiales bacterium]